MAEHQDLLSSIGGVDLPALGFGMGDVVLTELLRSRNLLPIPEFGTEYWVAADDDCHGRTHAADVLDSG